MSNRRLVSVAAVSTSGTAYTGRADGMFSTNDQAKLKQAGVWPTAIKAPSAPTAASATAGSLQATVSFTTPSSLNGETIISYTVTSLPGSVTATGASSPITVSGLTGGTSYTFTVVANTASGASLSSSASSSITVLNVTYSDDVFSTYLYTGNGSTQTINNGIDLAGKGGLVWVKRRNVGSDHILSTTARPIGNRINTNSGGAEVNSGTGFIDSFGSTGFNVGNGNDTNANAGSYVSWTFRKAEKFFDVVTWTGTGNTQTINHNLGVKPGMIIVKNVSSTYNWYVWHNGLSSLNNILLDGSGAQGYASGNPWITEPTATSFQAGGYSAVQFPGHTMVAYIFAHDTSSTGIIQCGSSVGGTNTTVTLGWEPQWLLVKKINAAQDWFVMDTKRGLNASQGDIALSPNTSGVEPTAASNFNITSTGFIFAGLGSTSDNYIYTAIRKPNKPL